MPDHSSHRIDRLRLSLGTSRSDAHALQERSSQLFHQQLKQDLNRLFGNLPDTPSLSIEQLVLDLGDIPEAQFETELRRRLLEALSQKLAEIIANAPPENDAEAAEQVPAAGHAASVRAMAHAAKAQSKRPLPFDADPGRVLPPEEALTLLLAWLEQGVFAAPRRWQAGGGPDGWLLPYLFPAAAEAAIASAAQMQRWKRVLARCCWQAAPLRRLTRTFSRATLRRLAQWLAEETPRQERPPMTQDPPEVWLPLCALLFFQRDAEPLALAAAAPWPAAQPLTRSKSSQAWLQHWTGRAPTPPATPALRAIARQWLEAADAAPPAAEQAAAQGQQRGKPARADKPSAVQEDLVLPVSSAGIALLWPMLPRWLSETGLVAQQRFIDVAAQHKAAQWLDALVWGWPQSGPEAGADASEDTPPFPEWRMTLAKLLCGLPLDTVLEPWKLTSADCAALGEQQEQWLATLPRQLQQLHRFSVQDLRSTFLQRPGLLLREEEHWLLEVETDAGDILLHDVPWPMTQVVLPWLDQPLAVAWLTGEGLRHG